MKNWNNKLDIKLGCPFYDLAELSLPLAYNILLYKKIKINEQIKFLDEENKCGSHFKNNNIIPSKLGRIVD